MKNNKLKNNIILLVIVVFVGIFGYHAYTAIALPYGPEAINRGSSGRADLNYSLKNTTALAGNVTNLDIVANIITKSWQGYYGEITGKIVLSDGNNNRFYDWNLTTPAGEVYASPNQSISWPDIKCFNYTANGSLEINLSIVESWFGISSTDSDSFANTFNQTTNKQFTTGSVTIEANTCPTTYMFENSSYQSSNFENVLLTDKSSLVFTSIISNDKIGFDNLTHDFQLLVAENGHTDTTTTTTYFFWIELT
ncbi:MAG: hypothetical protein QXG00_03290 [Candidatus Woesearchaeota archaeon]